MTKALVLACALVMGAGCGKKKEPPTTAAQATPATPRDSLAIVPLESGIALGGDFTSFSGSIELAGDQVAGGSLRFEVETASVRGSSEEQTARLKSPQLLDAAKYPKAGFTATEIRGGGAGGAHTVTGDLELHGVKKKVTFPATIAAKDGAVVVTGAIPVPRQEFGLAAATPPDDFGDPMVLHFTVRATRGAVEVPGTEEGQGEAKRRAKSRPRDRASTSDRKPGEYGHF